MWEILQLIFAGGFLFSIIALLKPIGMMSDRKVAFSLMFVCFAGGGYVAQYSDPEIIMEMVSVGLLILVPYAVLTLARPYSPVRNALMVALLTFSAIGVWSVIADRNRPEHEKWAVAKDERARQITQRAATISEPQDPVSVNAATNPVVISGTNASNTPSLTIASDRKRLTTKGERNAGTPQHPSASCIDGSEQDAFFASQRYVSAALNAPATADFGSFDEVTVSLVGDCQFSIRGEVQSRAANGAALRQTFNTRISKRGDGGWQLETLSLS